MVSCLLIVNIMINAILINGIAHLRCDHVVPETPPAVQNVTV